MKTPVSTLKKHITIFALIFTLFILGCFCYSYWRSEKYIIKLAKENADYFTSFAIKIVKWMSLKGGAFIKVDNKTKVSIYVPYSERMLVTKKGEKFAYVNVAQIIRELTSLKVASQEVDIKLISLYPVDPKNKPDNWEIKALNIVKKTKRPYFEFLKSKKFRYMYPLFVSKDCLKCHINLGLNIGEQRGGISITLPGEKYLAFKRENIISSLFFYSLIWIFGVIACIIFYIKNRNLIIQVDEANKRFRDVFEKSNLPMCILKDETFIDCNESFVKIFEAKSKEDIIGLHPWEVSPEKQPDGKTSKEKAIEMIKYGMDRGLNTFEWLHKTFKNKLIWEIITLTKLRDKKEEKIFATLQDITNLKKLENQLITTLNSISDAIIVTDINEKIAIVNPMAEKLVNLNSKNILGKRFVEIFKIYNRKDSNLIKSLSEFLEKNEKKYHKGTLITEDENKFLVEFYISELTGGINIQGFIISIKDITEKEKIEEELSKMNTLKKLGTLAGGIAHDFNNLLTGVYGNISLLKIKLKDEDLLNYIDKIEKSLERAVSLTSRLLTFAKGGTPILKPQSLKEILKEIPEFYIRGSNVKLHLDIQDDLWFANIDKNLVSNALSNLVINSIEAMPEGGILNIIAKNYIQQNESQILPKGEYIKIIIQDTGTGIDKKIKDKIFDPFFTTKEKGNGLGLSIVFSIIERHNGKIFVDSEKDKGTTFTVYLPAIKLEKSEIMVQLDNKEQLFKKKLNILVMDDEDVVRETIKEMLEVLNFNVDEAQDGEEVIDKVKEKNYDIIFLDLTIPGGKGGKEAIKDILKINSSAIVIGCSGYDFEDALPNYEELGFKAFLKKPFTFKELKELLYKFYEN